MDEIGARGTSTPRCADVHVPSGLWHGEDVFFILISMLVIVAVAGLVVVFVAFPHRGEDIPGAAWLGEGMAKAVDALPVIDPDAEEGQAGEHAGFRFGSDRQKTDR
jgi:hypothetical protein